MMNLLFVIDDGYVEQLKVTLYSLMLQVNRPVTVYLMQKTPLKQSENLANFCQKLGVTYVPIVVGEEAFKDAPTTDRYPDTIYYRLLAQDYLPENVEKILYLDADILCLNDCSALYDMDLGSQLYAAASHHADAKILELVNKLRLNNFEMESSYYNTGTLLMNIKEIRKIVTKEAILDYIEKNRTRLILPDQDVLNALYADLVVPVPDELYNYDARYSLLYAAKSASEWDLNWVINQTVFLHFAGRDKPWRPEYRGRYSGLYKFMEKQTKAFEAGQKGVAYAIDC